MKFLLRKRSVAMTFPRHTSFQKWLKKIFVKCIGRRQNRKKMIDCYNLSAHLMNDLGFDLDGNPTQWSTFSKTLPVSHEALPVKAKRTNLYVTDREDKHLELQPRV